MNESRLVDDNWPVVKEVGTFLAAVAAALRETTSSLQVTVDRITEFAALRSGNTDREVVMTLQDFDRLQQELAAIATMLSQIADKSGGTESATAAEGHPIKDAIAGISLADLKERLLRHISMTDLLALPTSDEVVF